MRGRTLLLNPGPVVLSDRVRAALAGGDACHREPEFAATTVEVLQRLCDVYPHSGRRHAAVLLSGSGTCAVEAMLATLAPRDGTTLVVSNGVYGDRMAAMLRAQGKPVAELSFPWLDGIDLDTVDSRLRDDPAISHVASVHHETTTGRLNDIAGLGRMCRGYDRPLLLDAVSSFGAELIDLDEWNVAAVAGSANKCLHGAPGVCFVLAQAALLESDTTPVASVYLDLRNYYRMQHDSGFSPFTPAVNSVFALCEALVELDDGGGWRARQTVYRDRAERVTACLRREGVDTLLPVESYSSVLRSYRLPKSHSYQALHDRLREQDIVIYGGQGDLGGDIFRIACMGEISDGDMRRLLTALADCLRQAQP
jgi:2-aminoethylphosphonate-pyruvate transaminase